MQKSFVAMTPQKRSLPLFHPQEEQPLSDLSPMLPHSLSNSRPALALQMLHSPLPAHRDLFSQLLATDPKPHPPSAHLMEEETYEDFDEFYRDQEESELEEDNGDNSDNEENEDNEDNSDSEIKKRKRKSSAQIKVLKQELEREGNWSKEKIAEMSELTGLSQSQVYKWWWDQKKKSIKHEKEAYRMLNKRKQIKKEVGKRTLLSYADHKLQPLPYQIEDPLQTKPKNAIDIEEAPQTEKKVNKRLVF